MTHTHARAQAHTSCTAAAPPLLPRRDMGQCSQRRPRLAHPRHPRENGGRLPLLCRQFGRLFLHRLLQFGRLRLLCFAFLRFRAHICTELSERVCVCRAGCVILIGASPACVLLVFGSTHVQSLVSVPKSSRAVRITNLGILNGGLNRVHIAVGGESTERWGRGEGGRGEGGGGGGVQVW